MTSIDRQSDRPVYRQIADYLRKAIESDEYAPGARLPSERMLMERFAAASKTVRQAIDELLREGLVDAEKGKGVFVRERPRLRRVAHDRFLSFGTAKTGIAAELESEGRRPRREVDHVGREQAPDDIARRLALAAGELVLVRSSRYFADDEPMEIATSYVPWLIAQDTAMVEENLGPGGIYARLEDLGHRLDHFEEEVEARMPRVDEARLLALKPGVPVFRLVRTAVDDHDTPVEVCDTIMAADRYVLTYRLPAQ